MLSDGLKKIGQFAFQSCTSLQSIAIPSSVTEIEKYAFINCNSLREVVVSEGLLKKIRSSVFQTCMSLQRITIPATVDKIEQFAFMNCSTLREVVLCEHLPKISKDAFIGCTSLRRFSFLSLSTRLNNVIQSGQKGIEAKMDDIPAVEWRGGEFIIPSIRQEIENQWRIVETFVEVDEEKLTTVKRLIRHYEIKEATTLFELALWKAGFDQKDISSPADRSACRIEVPGPVKDTILQYLGRW